MSGQLSQIVVKVSCNSKITERKENHSNFCSVLPLTTWDSQVNTKLSELYFLQLYYGNLHLHHKDKMK